MPATILPVQTRVPGGNTPAAEVASDATNGNQLASNNGVTTQLVATNTDSVSRTITFTPYLSTPPFTTGNWVVTLTAGQKWASGPLPLATFGPTPTFTCSNAAITISATQI